MTTIKTLAAILPLLAFAPAAAEEPVQPAYVMPQIPSEAEKIAALKLGYQLNGNSMVKTDSSIDLTAKSGAEPAQREGDASATAQNWPAGTSVWRTKTTRSRNSHPYITRRDP